MLEEGHPLIYPRRVCAADGFGIVLRVFCLKKSHIQFQYLAPWSLFGCILNAECHIIVHSLLLNSGNNKIRSLVLNRVAK